MKILPITNHFVYLPSGVSTTQNTLFPVEQQLTGYIYTAVPDIVTSRKIVFIQYDTAPWFHSSNIIQTWEENIKLESEDLLLGEMIALVSNNPNEVLGMISHYQELANQWKQKLDKDSVVNKLNRLYKEE